MRIVRVWKFEKYLEQLKYPDCRPSETNRPIITRVVGYFEYWRIDSDWAEQVDRRKAEQWMKLNNTTLDTIRDLPAVIKVI